MRRKELASLKNLHLAWRRIVTGGNQQYKRFFRHIYYAYEIAADDHLRELRSRILGGSWQPRPPTRLYVPKASGLQRPLSILHIEDQIVLQAFANLAAKKVAKRREPLQLTHVFSNIVRNPQDSVFFFVRWQRTYTAFQREIQEHYRSGHRWVADFDLSAFYDTISHDLLLRTIYPRTGPTHDRQWILKCLGCWSSGKSSLGHGLPQGPIASDFLAECFLLPIDHELAGTNGYTRYVDDVRLFGKTEDDVRRAVLALEERCRERGLIPQTGKFAIKRAASLKEALGMLPSIAASRDTTVKEPELDVTEAIRFFRSALGGRPRRIIDKTRARFVLYRSVPSSDMLRLVLPLVTRHPEHADAMFYHISQYRYRKPICDLCMSIVESNPYTYVQGEAWQILASYVREGALESEERRRLVQMAIGYAKRRSTPLMIRWGVGRFLCMCTEQGFGQYVNFLKYQPSMVQAITAPALPSSAYGRNGPVAAFLRRGSPEPGLAVVRGIQERSLSLSELGVDENSIPNQVLVTLAKVGVIRSRPRVSDPVGEILARRYDVRKSDKWKDLFGTEYTHAAGLLAQADPLFCSGPSEWLLLQNSFNQTMFLALQKYLAAHRLSGVVTTVNRRGELVDFGVTLESSNAFSRTYPRIADVFREVNSRRNSLPEAHPYSKKTKSRNRRLRRQERNRFVALLRDAYSGVLQLIAPLDSDDAVRADLDSYDLVAASRNGLQ
jgi:hypothetical protein